MKGLEKLTPIRLAEVLTQKGLVPNEIITDALYTQDRHGEPFAEVLVSTGHISEWDLAKLVVEHFQVPFLMASIYDINKKGIEGLPNDLLFRRQIVPLDRFDKILTVVMPILTPFDVLMKLGRDVKCEVYPYVGLVTENRKVLTDLYPDFKVWNAEQEKRREQMRKTRSDKPGEEGGNWMNMFDSADAKVRDGLKDP